jgi:hypothetical protein
MHKNLDFNIYLNPMKIDGHLMNMVNVTKKNGHEMDIFVEHSVIEEPEFLPLSTEEMVQ